MQTLDLLEPHAKSRNPMSNAIRQNPLSLADLASLEAGTRNPMDVSESLEPHGPSRPGQARIRFGKQGGDRLASQFQSCPGVAPSEKAGLSRKAETRSTAK